MRKQKKYILDIISKISKMPLAHITKTGNISIPKSWRDELGIEPNSNVIIEKKGGKLVIEPITRDEFANALSKIDAEIKRKGIKFTEEEIMNNDLYD